MLFRSLTTDYFTPIGVWETFGNPKYIVNLLSMDIGGITNTFLVSKFLGYIPNPNWCETPCSCFEIVPKLVIFCSPLLHGTKCSFFLSLKNRFFLIA
jgi:hypothetical protein